MKSNRNIVAWLIAALLSMTVFAVVSFAQSAGAAAVAAAPSSAFSADNIVQWITPIIVPLIIAVAKKFAPQIPGWALPILAPVLGVVIDLIHSAATAHQSNVIVAALLGLAGVGVREVKDQLTPDKPVGNG